jgi:hypothetical protein
MPIGSRVMADIIRPRKSELVVTYQYVITREGSPGGFSYTCDKDGTLDNVADRAVLAEKLTNTCHDCHTDYNMSGQELAPREQWGEETGESIADILAADSDCD